MQNSENARKGNSGNAANSNNNRHRNSSQDTPKWEAARAANAANSVVDAKVESVATKDGRPRGLNVVLDSGLPSFIPGSELPKGCDQKGLVGETIKVRIVEVNRRKGRLISSLKSVVDEERGSFISTLEEEQEVTGTVVRFNSEIGYFVDLGHGVDALLHLSQTALVDGKPEVLNKGQVITARVRSVSVEKGQVALTMRKPRPEQAHGNRRNVERFQTRTAKQATARALQLPKAAVVTTPAKPKGPRKLNNTSPKSKKNGFVVAFTSEGGNPFEQLAAFYASKNGGEAPAEAAPVAETPAAEPTVTSAE
jgi:ribosomal protein S1